MSPHQRKERITQGGRVTCIEKTRKEEPLLALKWETTTEGGDNASPLRRKADNDTRRGYPPPIVSLCQHYDTARWII